MRAKTDLIFQSMPPQPYGLHFQSRIEKEDEIPLKFQPAPSEKYVKKPQKINLSLSSSSHHSQIKSSNCNCCEDFESCFNFCRVDHQSHPDKQEKKWNFCCCLDRKNSQQICGVCLSLLCVSCKDSICIGFFICQECKHNLCSVCKGNLGIINKIELRNYPIRLKGQNSYHFRNCGCKKCQQRKKEEKRSEYFSEDEKKTQKKMGDESVSEREEKET